MASKVRSIKPKPLKATRLRGSKRVVAASAFETGGRGSGFAFTAAQARRSMDPSLATTSGSAGSDLVYDLPTIRERSRALERNNAIAAGAINTLVVNAIGPQGRTMQSRIDGDYLGLTKEETREKQRTLERYWAWFSKANSYPQKQAMALRSKLVNGDLLVVRDLSPDKRDPVRLRVRLVEADRISEKANAFGNSTKLDNGGHIFHGIEVDAKGDVVAYHVLDRHPGDYGTPPTKAERIPAKGAQSGEWMALHVGRPERIDQLRALPLFSPVIEPLHLLSEFIRTKVVHEQIRNKFTVFVKTANGAGLGALTDDDATAQAATPEEYRLGDGAILDLAEGEDIVLADPRSDGTGTDVFLSCMLRQVGPAIGFPLEVLQLFFQGSYSAARASLQQFWKTVLDQGGGLDQQMNQPCFEAMVCELVADGKFDAPGFFEDPMIRHAYCRAEWTGPAQGQIDPLKEVQAAAARIALEVSTLQEETASLTGGDWDSVHAQRVVETQAQRRDGLDIESVAERIRTEPMAPEEDPDAADEAEQEPPPVSRKRQARRVRT